MKIINTKLHGLLDYVVAFFLIVPWLSNYNVRGEDTWILGVAGLLLVGYSVITDFEYGLLKFLPMKLHLVLDLLVAIFLIVMPVFITVHNYYFYWPVMMGFVQLVLVILSDYRPYRITHHDLDITRHA